MSSEPVWRALVKALSDFSFFFPPVSKLKPSFEGKDMHEMLVLCCKSIVTHPSAEMMLKIRKSQQAAQYLQVTCRNFPAHLSLKPYLSTHNLCSGSSRDATSHSPFLLPASAKVTESSGPAHGGPARDRAHRRLLSEHRSCEYVWGKGESTVPVNCGDRLLGTERTIRGGETSC